MNSVVNLKESLISVQNKLRSRRQKLQELDESIDMLTIKANQNDTLMNRTDLALAKAEKTNLNSNIFFLEQEEYRLKSLINRSSQSQTAECDQSQPY